MELWVVFALASAFLSAANSLIDRHVMKDVKDPEAFSLFINLAGAIVFLFLFWMLGGASFTFDPLGLLIALVAGVIYTGLSVLNFHVDAHAEATLKRPVIRTRVVVTLLFSALLFGEALNELKLVALVLILAGGFYANTRRGQSVRDILKNPMTGLLFFTAFVFGVISLFDKQGATLLGAIPYSLVAYGVPSILTWFIVKDRRERLRALIRQKSKVLALKTFIEPLSFLVLVIAYVNGPAGQIALFREIALPLAFIGGILVLGESDNLPRRALGALVVVAGSILAAIA